MIKIKVFLNIGFKSFVIKSLDSYLNIKRYILIMIKRFVIEDLANIHF